MSETCYDIMLNTLNPFLNCLNLSQLLRKNLVNIIFQFKIEFDLKKYDDFKTSLFSDEWVSKFQPNLKKLHVHCTKPTKIISSKLKGSPHSLRLYLFSKCRQITLCTLRNLNHSSWILNIHVHDSWYEYS